MAAYQQPYNYTGQSYQTTYPTPQSPSITGNTAAPLQQPEMGSFEWVNNAEEVQNKNPGIYMNRNEPVMYKKAYSETGLQFEVFDLVKREPVQNAGNFVTKDELSAAVEEAVRKAMKHNRKEHNNG